MGAWTIPNISENTAEDFIDEGVSNLVYGIGNCYFGDKTNYNCNDLVENSFKEALEGAGQTLKFTIMNAVIFRVTEYAMTKLIFAGGLFYAYVKSGGVIKKIKDKISGSSLKGKKGIGALTTMLDSANGTEQERLKLVGMANDSANNIASIVATERQTLSMQTAYQRKQLMTSLGLSQNSKGLNDRKKLEAYNLKMKTGSWSIADKKLFYDCVPKQYLNGLTFNQSFIDKLNQYSEYAKTTENKLVNLAQTHLDLITASNLSKVK